MFSQSQMKMAFIAVRRNHLDMVKLVGWLSCVDCLLSVILRWFPFDACCTTDVISTTTVAFFSHFSNYSLDELRVVFIIMFFWGTFHCARRIRVFGRISVVRTVCFVFILHPVCTTQNMRIFSSLRWYLCRRLLFLFYFLLFFSHMIHIKSLRVKH